MNISPWEWHTGELCTALGDQLKDKSEHSLCREGEERGGSGPLSPIGQGNGPGFLTPSKEVSDLSQAAKSGCELSDEHWTGRHQGVGAAGRQFANSNRSLRTQNRTVPEGSTSGVHTHGLVLAVM